MNQFIFADEDESSQSGEDQSGEHLVSSSTTKGIVFF